MRDTLRALRLRLERFARPRAPEAFPVELHRRRIYVLPTRFGLFFAVMLLAMGVGALNYNNNPALLLMLLLAGAAQTSLLGAHLQLSGLRLVAVSADPVPAGAPILLRLHARAPARGRERRGLRVDCPGAGGTLTLDDGVGEAELALPTQHRGWLDVPRLRVSTTRPLGLVRAVGFHAMVRGGSPRRYGRRWCTSSPSGCRRASAASPAPSGNGGPLGSGAG